jgi:glutamyl-tRNA synthetase
MRTTRLAPSPTGAFHLGNARSFLVNWILARQRGWRVLLRVEDIDGPRIKPGADRQAIDDLRWLGIDWDEGPIYQSQRLPLYRKAWEKLLADGAAYPCVCSRGEVAAAASAPHAEDGAAVYPGTCRERFATVDEARATGREPAIRFRVPDESMTLDDGFAGARTFDLARELGDFVIAKADGAPAYQLAVVVDDLASGVTDVVRGDDLLDSTPRQMLLYEALGRAADIPRYYHLPLVVGPDGRRLAKRHGDTRLAHYRERGVAAERLLALLARWCGVPVEGERITADELLARFDLARLPRERIVFGKADDRWLLDNGPTEK